MERRNAIKLAVGAMAAGGVGVATLANAFNPEVQAAEVPKSLEYKEVESNWKYTLLDPAVTAEHAYYDYPKGSCMFGVFNSVISQLAETVGEPFTFFPTQMMNYGHGGVNGSGTICGTLNGAAAFIGLLVEGKATQDALMAELFRLYEETPFPTYKPVELVSDFVPPTSVAKSVLCHTYTTKWGKKAGYRIDSKERKERCRRLTADVAAQAVVVLNNYFDNAFVTSSSNADTANSCMACHGNKGKLGNISGKMNFTSCHEKSLAHKVFGDAHCKFMTKK